MCGAFDVFCVVMGEVGNGLLASGVGAVMCIAVDVLTSGVGLVDILEVHVSYRCSARVAKHKAVRIACCG